jgi:putative membrane-bound dehydrogenase-like protein
MKRAVFLPLIGFVATFPCLAVEQPAGLSKPAGPLAPREELATFQVPRGFTVELAAAEPDVIDPVALAFDEDGRLFVVEMRGYPNAGVGEGKPNLPGRVKLLEDRDGDGYFEHSTVYVDDLRFPTGVTCWRGGVIIGNAPDLLYCKDTDGDGRADVRRVLYTGFGIKNIQQLVNGLQFHFDTWVHGCNGSNDTVLTSPGRPGGQPVALRGRHFRFKPDDLASLEPTSGGGQYGLAADDWGNWFTCTNSQHLRHIVLPDHYLKRNPHLAVPAVVLDIPDGVREHGPAAKVHRISPFEPWRVERTTRRKGGPDAKRFAATELVPGGYITSACGLVVYRGGAYPREYHGNVFVCDPANNLIHRDILMPAGPTFTATRPAGDCEFLASTDTWFRPVFLCLGPDGCLYVADFYREIIETPLSLPEDIQKRYNLQSRQRGRIWRIAWTGGVREKGAPKLSKAGTRELLGELAHANAWRRLTAQRLLIERQAQDAVDSLRTLAGSSDSELARLHALYTLEGLGALDATRLEAALRDPSAGVREHALRLAEPYLDREPKLRELALALVDDPAPRVRFQLAFTLGSLKPDANAAAALARLARRDGANPWAQTAILSSARHHAAFLLRELLPHDDVAPQLLARLAGLVAAGGDEAEIERALLALTAVKDRPTPRQLLVLDGMAQHLARRGRPLAKRMSEQTAAGKQLTDFMAHTARLAAAEETTLADRLAAVRLLGHGPFAASAPLQKLLTPQYPAEVQIAAVQALSGMSDPQVAEVLLAGWSAYSPVVRREVQEALFARPDRLSALLSAVEKGEVLAAHLDLARRELLLKHPNPALRTRAKALFAGQVPPERKNVVEEYQAVLDLKGDPARGKVAFKKHCATCHRLENEGFEVGPELLAVLKNKSADTLLIDILDPSREVDPRFLNYIVSDRDGRLFTGIIASETAASLVLRRAERAEDTLLRADIDMIQSTAKSLMPEGFEKQMTRQELADVIAYLLSVTEKR